MRPHACALIGVVNYLHKKDEGVRFDVRVRTPKGASLPYTIRVKMIGKYQMHLEVSDRWSCQAFITISNDEFTIRHQHTRGTYEGEQFRLTESQIYSREPRSGERYGKFEGHLYDAMKLNIYDPLHGRYDVAIERVEKK